MPFIRVLPGFPLMRVSSILPCAQTRSYRLSFLIFRQTLSLPSNRSSPPPSLPSQQPEGPFRPIRSSACSARALQRLAPRSEGHQRSARRTAGSPPLLAFCSLSKLIASPLPLTHGSGRGSGWSWMCQAPHLRALTSILSVGVLCPAPALLSLRFAPLTFPPHTVPSLFLASSLLKRCSPPNIQNHLLFSLLFANIAH